MCGVLSAYVLGIIAQTWEEQRHGLHALQWMIPVLVFLVTPNSPMFLQEYRNLSICQQYKMVVKHLQLPVLNSVESYKSFKTEFERLK